MLNIGCGFEVEGRLYTVLELLGKGANAAAYLAQCQNGGLAAKCILKEYSPADLAEGDPAFAEGKARFVAAGRAQNRIRQISALGNQTRPSTEFLKRTAPLMSRSPAITALRSIS